MNFWDAFFIALIAFVAGAALVALAADRTIARLNKQRATFADKVLQDSRELLATFDELRKIHNAQGLAYEACLKKNDELRRMLKRLVLSPESYTARAAIEQALAGTKHEAFEVMAQGQYDHSLEAFPIRSEEFGVMLTIATPDAAVYVTKEQAAKFFGFDAETKALEDELVRVRGVLAELVECVEIKPGQRKQYFDIDKYLQHAANCRLPRGDQSCACGMAAVRCNVDVHLDECEGYHGVSAIDKARAALSPTTTNKKES